MWTEPLLHEQTDTVPVLVEQMSWCGWGLGWTSYLTITRWYHQVTDGGLWEHLEDS